MPRKSKSVGRANGHVRDGAQAMDAPARPADFSVIDEIRSLHRERVFAMDLRKSIDLKLGSFLRTQLGWRLSLSEDERKQIAERAAEQMESGDAGRYSDLVETTKLQREPFAEIERKCVTAMERLAVTLPVWPMFGEPIRGFGPASLAVIVAEAGNLSNYPNPGKLWKRMGLAVMDGVRQGGLPKSASKEDWIAHGYNRERRSRMWNIGDALIKGNREGEYRTLYLSRKEFELARDPEMKPIKAHRRAQRYMEKRLLRNLWQAWRRAAGLPEYVPLALPDLDVAASVEAWWRANPQVEPNGGLPAAPLSPSGSATLDVETIGALPSRKRRATKSVDTAHNVPADHLAQAEEPLTSMAAVPAKRSAEAESSPKLGVPSAPIRRTKKGASPIATVSSERPTSVAMPPRPPLSGD